jgi:hypothetical protein
MYWADYRTGAKKAKGHFGFDVNRKIPIKIYLTDGNGGERPFVRSILKKGQTGIMDRGYQSHKNFDLLQDENKHFICRIKAKTTRTIIKEHTVDPDSYIFYDAMVLLGTSGVNQTPKSQFGLLAIKLPVSNILWQLIVVILQPNRLQLFISSDGILKLFSNGGRSI